RRQAMHGAIIDDILSNDKPIDAVIFTGDAVMSNFPLWRKSYWRCFLCQTNRLRAAGILFFPTLGNHEVLSEALPVIRAATLVNTNYQIPALKENLTQQLAKAYDAGENFASSIGPGNFSATTAATSQIDVATSQGRNVLKGWERRIWKGDLDSARKFGQFEGQLQANFYA